jgi:hypothetical protein
VAPLASVESYETVVGPVGAGDRDRVAGLLAMASDAVLEAAHGQQILAATSSDVTVYAHEGVLYLPQRPVTAVASVEVDGNLIDPDSYRWEPGGRRRHARIIYRSAGADSRWTAPEAVVTYSHGWATVPGPIVAVVCRMAFGALSAGGGGVAVEWRAEDLSEKVDPATVPAADMSITGAAQRTIDAWCGVAPLPGGVILRAG